MYSFNEFCKIKENSDIHLQEFKGLAGAVGGVLGGLQKGGAALGRAFRKGANTPHQRAIDAIDVIGGALASLNYQNDESGQKVLRYLQSIRLDLENKAGITPSTYTGGDEEQQQQAQEPQQSQWPRGMEPQTQTQTQTA